MGGRIDELVIPVAEARGATPAILAPGRPPLSYRELANQIVRARSYLASIGIGAGDSVAVSLGNGPEIASAFLTLASSVACAPLNPTYREKELEFYLTDLQARAIVVHDGEDSLAANVARQLGIGVLRLKSPASQPAGWFELELEGNVSPRGKGAFDEDVALVLHTSGSTGRPKLVPLSGANIMRSARNVGQTLRLQSDDRCLNVMPLFHIHGLIAAVSATAGAGASVVATPGYRADQFFAWLDEFEATWYTAVPTIHQSVLELATQSPERAAASTLRLIRSSSSSLPPVVMTALEKAFDVPVVEAYGMTEAAHQMCCNPLPPAERKPGSVGPSAGPEVTILDAEGQPVPRGERGEISIRGPNVTSGYVRNPEANASSFTEDGWFRTGDQGWMDDDGYVYISGRFKEQINRAGEKIMPREVDEVLLRHPDVDQAVTFAVPHKTLGEDIAAAVVLREGAKTDPSEIRKFVLAELAEYKAPYQVLILDELPKGPSGKLVRIGLADVLQDELQQAGAVEPANETEAALCAVWAETLGLEKVGATDNFFALGGDSLVMAALAARAEDHLLQFSPDDLIRYPTVRDLAPHVTRLEKPVARATVHADARESLDLSDLPELTDPEAIERAHGVTRSQQLWLERYARDGRTVRLNCVISFSLEGPLDPERLRGAWSRLVERHDVLRSCLVSTAELGWVQAVHKSVELPWSMVDLSSKAPPEQTEALVRHVRDEMAAGFAIDAAPLLRATLFQLAEQKFEVHLAYWHGLLDVWSHAILLEEMAAIYRSSSGPVPGSLRAPPDFGAFVSHLSSRSESEADPFWRDYLAGFKGPTAIFDLDWRMKNWLQGSEEYSAQEVQISDADSRKLRAWARRQNLSLNTFLQGVWAIVLAGTSGDDDVLYNSGFGRRRLPVPSLDRMIGSLAAAIPTRVKLKDQPLAEWMQGIQEGLLELGNYEWATPFARLKNFNLELEEGQAIAQSSWNYLAGPDAWFGSDLGDGVKAGRAINHYNSYRIRLDVYPSRSILLRLVHDERALRSADAAALVERFMKVATAIVTNQVATPLAAKSL